MEFTLVFFTNSSAFPVLSDAITSRRGLEWLEFARREIGEHVPAENIRSLETKSTSIISFVLKENEVADIYDDKGVQVFKNTDMVEVGIPSGGLDKFAKYKFILPTGGEIWHAELNIQLDKLLADWKSAGCPRFWRDI